MLYAGLWGTEWTRDFSGALIFPCLGELRFPIQEIGRERCRAHNIDLDVNGCCRLAESEFQLDLATRSGVRDVDLLALDWSVTLAEEHASQLVTSKRVHRKVTPHPDQHLESIQLVLHRDRFNWARFEAKEVIRRLARAVDIDDSMDPLLQCTHTAIAHMSAIVVVTEENCSAHEISLANHSVM